MRAWPWLIIGTLAALSPNVAAAAERPIVVELFTSQGCSSCPPANAYLNGLSKQRADVLALAFHVTYWDYLGWKDPFTLQTATDRQARYGQRFGDGSYTPEIVVDGSSGLVGSYRDDRASITNITMPPISSVQAITVRLLRCFSLILCRGKAMMEVKKKAISVSEIG